MGSEVCGAYAGSGLIVGDGCETFFSRPPARERTKDLCLPQHCTLWEEGEVPTVGLHFRCKLMSVPYNVVITIITRKFTAECAWTLLLLLK